jgi:F-type H+-transporting ATPase subunit delta
MIPDSEVYARALFNSNIRNDEAEAGFKTVLESPELLSVLQNPCVLTVEKKACLSRIFDGNFKNFMFLVTDNGLCNEISDIFENYLKIKSESGSSRTIELIAAKTPGSAELDKVKASVNLLYGIENPDIKITVNPELLRGFILRVDDKEIDYSLKGRIDKLSQGINK